MVRGSFTTGRRTPRALATIRTILGGKVTTFFQFLTLLALIFRPGLVLLFVLAVGITSVYAIIDYGVYLIKQEQLARLEKERPARARD